MKFEYEDDADRGEVVAYLTLQGNILFAGENGKMITLCEGGSVHSKGSLNGQEPFRKFYKGDKITITF